MHDYEYLDLCSEELSLCMINGDEREHRCVKPGRFNYSLVLAEPPARGGHLGEVIRSVRDARPAEEV